MKYIRGFDGLRATSIIFVLTGHLWFPELLPDNSFLKNNYSLISGLTGVMMFFTLSGFLITILLLEEKKAKGRIEFKKFFIRRFLRLLPPLIIFYTAVSVLMLTRQLPSNFRILLISFFYSYNFVPTKYWVGEVSHTWSLGVEEQFYLFWPFVINAVKSIKKALRIPAIIIVLCLICIKLFPVITLIYEGKERYFKDVYFADRWFIPACLPIMTGAIAAIVVLFHGVHIQKLFFNNLLLPAISILFYFSLVYNAGFLHDYNSAIQAIGVAIMLIWYIITPEAIWYQFLNSDRSGLLALFRTVFMFIRGYS